MSTGKTIQAILPSQLLMMRPRFFRNNSETGITNLFQNVVEKADLLEQHYRALNEFDGYVDMYRSRDIDVIVSDPFKGVDLDLEKLTPEEKQAIPPDEIFPNCVVTFPGGDLVNLGRIGYSKTEIDPAKTYAILLPMLEKNRQQESPAMVKFLQENGYEVIDDVFEESINYYQSKRMALEGTGALVLDRPNKIVYCALSDRAHPSLAKFFAKSVGYELVAFDTIQHKGKPIYHTDLLTHIGGGYQNICSGWIADKDKDRVLSTMRAHRTVYELNMDQFYAFCGNSQPVVNGGGKEYLSMSRGAHLAFGDLGKKIEAEQGIEIISAPIYTIEYIGGGSGCCLAQEGRHIHKTLEL